MDGVSPSYPRTCLVGHDREIILKKKLKGKSKRNGARARYNYMVGISDDNLRGSVVPSIGSYFSSPPPSSKLVGIGTHSYNFYYYYYI